MLLKEQKEREKARSIEDKKAIMALRSKRRRGERKLTKEEALRARLPESALLRIVQHLTLTETFRFMVLGKYVRQAIIYRPEFEGQWVIKSFQGLLSKSGFSGLRNNNLRRIDIQQRGMHFQAKSIVLDCIDDQWHIFGLWWNLAFLLLFLVTPILLIVNEERELDLSARILFIPTTISWFALIITLAIIKRKINMYHKRVVSLDQSQQGQPGVPGTPRGRNTTHCTHFTKTQFTIRFLISLVWSLLWLYFGVFVKVYAFDWLEEEGVTMPIFFITDEDGEAENVPLKMKWVHALGLGCLPALLMYVKEILQEVVKS